MQAGSDRGGRSPSRMVPGIQDWLPGYFDTICKATTEVLAKTVCIQYTVQCSKSVTALFYNNQLNLPYNYVVHSGAKGTTALRFTAMVVTYTITTVLSCPLSIIVAIIIILYAVNLPSSLYTVHNIPAGPHVRFPIQFCL